MMSEVEMTNRPRKQFNRALSCHSIAIVAVGLCWLPICLPGAQLAAPPAPAKAAPAKATPAPAVSVDVEIPQSVFVDDIKKGKDPFFPNSKRREGKAPPPPPDGSPKPPGPTPPPPPPPIELKLKGLAGTVDRRLAIINDTTVALGETVEIKAGRRSVKVRLLEFRPNSVIYNIDGSPERKELFLRGE